MNSYSLLAATKNKVNFITSKPCILRENSHITNATDTLLDLYGERGFNIIAVHGDKEFKTNPLKAKLLPICTDIYGKEEHVGILERMIRVIKERARCMCHAIPYQYYTKLIIKSLISFVVKLLKIIPTKGRILKQCAHPCYLK